MFKDMKYYAKAIEYDASLYESENDAKRKEVYKKCIDYSKNKVEELERQELIKTIRYFADKYGTSKCVGIPKKELFVDVLILINELEVENERLNEIIKSYQQPVSAHFVKNSRTHGETLEVIKEVEQETLKRFTEYIKGKLSATYKEHVSEKNDGDFKLGASLLLVAQGEIEKAKGEFTI